MAHAISKLDDVAIEQWFERHLAYRNAGIELQCASDPGFDRDAHFQEMTRRQLFHISIKPNTVDTEINRQMDELAVELNALLAAPSTRTALEDTERQLRAAQRGHRATGPIYKRMMALRNEQLRHEIVHKETA